MNENIDLTKVLKHCPKGTKFYSPIFGEVYFEKIRSDKENAIVFTRGVLEFTLTKEGFYDAVFGEECLLFPSKDQRDWSKFTATWYKKERFDPNTLKPFDRILCRLSEKCKWTCSFFSYADDNNFKDAVNCMDHYTTNVIPYNEETKHLVGTKEEAPEYYRYWED